MSSQVPVKTGKQRVTHSWPPLLLFMKKKISDKGLGWPAIVTQFAGPSVALQSFHAIVPILSIKGMEREKCIT